MMGYQSSFQHKLFIMGFSLEKRIRKDHILRKILEKINFDFIYKEAKDTYGENGNVFVPPPVILDYAPFSPLRCKIRERTYTHYPRTPGLAVLSWLRPG